MEGWTDGGTDGFMHRWTDEQMDGWLDGFKKQLYGLLSTIKN
jgi:hypothetical protein